MMDGKRGDLFAILSGGAINKNLVEGFGLDAILRWRKCELGSALNTGCTEKLEEFMFFVELSSSFKVVIGLLLLNPESEK